MPPRDPSNMGEAREYVQPALGSLLETIHLTAVLNAADQLAKPHSGSWLIWRLPRFCKALANRKQGR